MNWTNQLMAAVTVACATSVGFATTTYTVTLLPADGVTATSSVGVGIDSATIGGIISNPVSGYSSAAAWTGSTWAPLSDADEYSVLTGVSGNFEVGSLYPKGIGGQTAVVWAGTSAAYTILPTTNGNTNYSQTFAAGISGTTVVGQADNVAVVWRGFSAAPENLAQYLPTGYNVSGSAANATNGIYAVGTAYNSVAGDQRAVLWNLSTHSVLDLAAGTGYETTSPNAVSGNQVVGESQETIGNASVHAMLWTLSADGTSSSVTDLNPNTASASDVYGTNGSAQVGWVTEQDGSQHATLWTGTAASAEDLSLALSLPTGYTDSYAYSIDAEGNILGYAADAAGDTIAVEWNPSGVAVPEPTSLAILSPALAVAILGLTKRRRSMARS